MDEAIAKWGDYGYQRKASKPKEQGAKLGGKSEYVRTTNQKAYRIGRKFLEHVDFILRGRGGLKAFLRMYLKRKSRQSVTTAEFQSLMEEFYGDSLDELFDEFVY